MVRQPSVAPPISTVLLLLLLVVTTTVHGLVDAEVLLGGQVEVDGEYLVAEGAAEDLLHVLAVLGALMGLDRVVVGAVGDRAVLALDGKVVALPAGWVVAVLAYFLVLHLNYFYILVVKFAVWGS